MFNTTPKKERRTGMTDGEFVPPESPTSVALVCKCSHCLKMSNNARSVDIVMFILLNTKYCCPLKIKTLFYVTLYLLKVLES